MQAGKNRIFLINVLRVANPVNVLDKYFVQRSAQQRQPVLKFRESMLALFQVRI